MTQTIFERVLTGADAALLVGLPRTEDQWWAATLHEDSFAIRYRTPENYARSLDLNWIGQCLDRVSGSRQVAVAWPFTKEDIARLSQGRSLVLVVSHLSPTSRRIESGDGLLEDSEFVGAFDKNWRGALVLAGCNSETVRVAYERRFGHKAVCALNRKDLSADFWLSFYARTYLPALSRTSLPFGQFAITMSAAANDALRAQERLSSASTES
jgi:hypothetical protein